MSAPMPDMEFLIKAGKASMDDRGEYTPMLIVTDTTGQVSMIAMAVDGNPAAYLEHVLRTVNDPIESVSFTVDTYHTSDPLTPRPFSAAFAAGDPRVSEALAVTIVTAESAAMALLPYTRTTDGIVWGDDQILEGGGSLGGRVIESLIAAIAQSHRRKSR
jgi:hypothetical protein